MTERNGDEREGNQNALASPGKTPVPLKKQKGSEEPANSAILAAIDSLKEMMTGLKNDMNQNALSIANIAKSVEFNHSEIKKCQERNKELETEIKHLKATNGELSAKVLNVEKKAADLERYKRRWNLRLNGLKEDKEENTRKKVADIIIKILPHWYEKMDLILDTVHRLGANNTSRPRQIIMQFTGRIYRDELWRCTKQHPVCREFNIRFAEDLIKEDREARLAVWPKVEQAPSALLQLLNTSKDTDFALSLSVLAPACSVILHISLLFSLCSAPAPEHFQGHWCFSLSSSHSALLSVGQMHT
ncbi:hypothetical protein WMY93_024821 [Mugilogobius chulae]|uniref:Cytoplasmic dynein 2 heavy chain 1-like protein n=1 Tax=Mugilogobius chulae TaxID=88201 RepID=A0AAW0N7H6_9GOBI